MRGCSWSKPQRDVGQGHRPCEARTVSRVPRRTVRARALRQSGDYPWEGRTAMGTYVALLLDGALAVLLLGVQHQVERAGLLVDVRLALAPLADGEGGGAGQQRVVTGQARPWVPHAG